jgi:hypothetical protein
MLRWRTLLVNRLGHVDRLDEQGCRRAYSPPSELRVAAPGSEEGGQPDSERIVVRISPLLGCV